MSDYIRHQVALDYPHSGGSIRQNFISVSKQSKLTFEQLVAAQCGEDVNVNNRLPRPGKYEPKVRYLYDLFIELSDQRQRDYNGYPQRVSNQELMAYLQLKDIQLMTEEIDALRAFDNAWVIQSIIEGNKARAND